MKKEVENLRKKILEEAAADQNIIGNPGLISRGIV